ncbi:MAG TPA: hypothetical protein VD929_03640 [Caulobacteraceae bacterium]|nr:hypothetical protein [Caulobacteraceae bacterium]
MVRFSGIAVAVCALAFAGAAADAHAQSKPKSRTDAAAAQAFSEQSAAKGRKSLQWNNDGRWSLKLDQDQPVGREADWKDVEAGAYYRLTPSLRVGGSFGLGERKSDPARLQPEEKAQPRVRLETTFRF